MKKLIISVLCLLLAVSTTFAEQDQNLAQQEPRESRQYFDKLSQFEALTDYQTKSFMLYVQARADISSEAQEQLKSTIALQQVSLNQMTTKLKALYTKAFIDKTASKEDRKTLVADESNVSVAVHRQLVLLHDFLKSKSLDSLWASRKLIGLTKKLNEISIDLKEGKSIDVTVSMGLNQLLQAGRNRMESFCTLAIGLCKRDSLSELMDSLEERNFLRSEGFSIDGIQNIKSELDANDKAVFILIGNHDQPLMDIALARKVSLALGSQKHITMTRKSVYPIPPPESAGDVVFVVDNDPKSNPVQKSLDIVSQNILSEDVDRVSLAVYPEGMLPYTGGQMPMTVKEGAFVIARKLAHQLAAKNIPVFLVQMKTNIIQHLTSVKPIPAEVNMESIEKVPTEPIDRLIPDAWIELKRLEAENSFNAHRGITQIDIFNLDNDPSSRIPYSMEMKSCQMLFFP